MDQTGITARENRKYLFFNPWANIGGWKNIFKDRFSAFLPKPVFHQAHIGESLSLIYAPYYRNHQLYDAVLNEPIASDPLPDFEELIATAGSPDWGIRFLPTLCPNCGWDLEGQRDALVLLCRNCNSAWTAGKDRFVKIEFAQMAESGPNLIFRPGGDLEGRSVVRRWEPLESIAARHELTLDVLRGKLERARAS